MPEIPLQAHAIPRSILLVVDDQPVNIQILNALFQDEHQILMATSGEQALASCLKNQPDLVLLDVVMPDMDGYAVCQRLKARPETADIPIIFVTAQSNPTEEAAGLELGAVDYITKPITPAVVRARVNTQLALRHAMKTLAENESRLELRVAERSAELESIQSKLRQSQENLIRSEAKATLSTLVASVSHDLGTPLGNGMIMASTLTDEARQLQQKIDNGQIKRSDLAQFLLTLNEGTALIQRNLERASALLKNFRQVAADQASEQRRSFDLATTIEEIIGSLAPTLKHQPHKVVSNIPAGICMDSYPGPLGQVVINLINNAFLHAFEGRSDGLLEISAAIDGNTVCLRFADNGVGIPPENLEKIFNPFFSTKINQGGTGLGMSIVQNLVKHTLGGTIAVDSTPGHGAVFIINLPLSSPA